MIEVTDADGTVHEFPDDTTEQEIDQMLNAKVNAPSGQTVSNSPPQISGPGRIPALVGSELLRGAGAVAGLPGDLEAGLTNLGNKYLPSWATQPLVKGFPQLSGASNTLFPTSNDLLEATGRLGLVDRSDLQPQGSTEQTIAGTSRGVGSALPMLPFGGADAVIPSLVAGGAGGAVSQLAPGNVPLELGAGALAGTAAGKLAAGAERLVGATGLTDEAQEFARAGIPMRSAALTSGNALTQATLGRGAPVKQTEQDLGNAIERHADSLGQSRTLQDAGTAVQAEAKSWNNVVMPQKEAAAWAPVDAAIPANTPVDLMPVINTLQGIVGKGGSLASAVAKLRPALPDRLLDELTTMSPGTMLGGPTWQDVRELRTALGKLSDFPQIAQSIGQQNIEKLYAATTQALGTTAKSVGADDLFNAANQTSSQLRAFQEGTVSKILEAKPEDAASSLLNSSKKGGTDLQAIRNEMPKAADELGAAQLRQSALEDPTDAVSVVDKRFPARWANMSPKAKAAMFPSPSQRDSIDAAAAITGRLKTASKPNRNTPAAESGIGMGLGTIAGAAVSHALGMTGDLLPEAIGGTLGAVAPAVGAVGRNILANNRMLARYAGTNAPNYAFPFQLSGAGALGAGNLLLFPREENK